jgi:hypothetical protein
VGLWPSGRAGRRDGGATGDLGDTGHAESDGGVASLNRAVDLCKFVLGGGQADPESFGFAEPALAYCFGDAGGEVVADVDQALRLGGVNAKEWAADAALTENDLASMMLVRTPHPE